MQTSRRAFPHLLIGTSLGNSTITTLDSCAPRSDVPPSASPDIAATPDADRPARGADKRPQPGVPR